MRPTAVAAIIVATFSSPQLRAAADPPAASAAPIQELRKISVTATRGPRAIDAIAATVTVIDEAQIEARLASDIKDLVRYEPGVSMANSPARFGLAGFNIRGIDGNRVLMRIDGVRMADAFSIGSFADARRNLVDLDAVKSVEIVRGAASALYGSDAIGGVVSFIMKEPADLLRDGRNVDLTVRSGYQSDDDGWHSGGRLAFGGERLAGLLLYSHGAGHETGNQGDIAAGDRTRTRPNPQDHDSDSVLAKLDWSSSDAQALRLTLAADTSTVSTDVLSSVGAQGTVNTQSMQGEDRQRRRRASLGHELFADALLFDSVSSTFYVQSSETRQRTAERRFATAAGPSSAVRRARKFDFEQSLSGAEFVLRKDLPAAGAAHFLTYGIDFALTRTEQLRDGVQTNLASGAQSSNIPPDDFPVRDFPKTKTRQYAAFAQDEIDVADGAWRIIPALRIDRYELDPRSDPIFVADNPASVVHAIEATSLTPKLGVIRAFGASHSMFAQYARGFRAPPYNDVNIGFTNLAFGYTALANPALEPETSDGYELGWRAQLERGSFALSGFYNDYQDFIESLANTGVRNGLIVFQSRNLARARVYGVEFSGGVELETAFPRLPGWTMQASVAWARGDNRVTGAPLNSVDPLKAVLGIAYTPAARRWGIQLVGTAVARKSRVDQSAAVQFAPPGYTVVDLLFHAHAGERLRIDVGVFNLTDRKYWEWSDVRGRLSTDTAIDRYTRPGLNAGASASIRF